MRKPTEIKKMQGTYRKDRATTNEPKPQYDLKQVVAPAFLTSGAQNLWNFALEQAPSKLLTTIDYGVFAQWCITMDQIIEVSKELKEAGTFILNDNNERIANPHINILVKLLGAIKSIQNELGFTPASRTKINSIGLDGCDEPNPFNEL